MIDGVRALIKAEKEETLEQWLSKLKLVIQDSYKFKLYIFLMKKISH